MWVVCFYWNKVSHCILLTLSFCLPHLEAVEVEELLQETKFTCSCYGRCITISFTQLQALCAILRQHTEASFYKAGYPIICRTQDTVNPLAGVFIQVPSQLFSAASTRAAITVRWSNSVLSPHTEWRVVSHHVYCEWGGECTPPPYGIKGMLFLPYGMNQVLYKMEVVWWHVTKSEEAVSVGDINSPSPSFSSSPSCSVASRVPRSEAPPYSYHSGSPSPSPHRLAPPPPPWLPGGPGTQSHNNSHTASSTTMHNIVYLFQICSTFLY